MSLVFKAGPHATAEAKEERVDLWTNFMRRMNAELEDYHAPAA